MRYRLLYTRLFNLLQTKPRRVILYILVYSHWRQNIFIAINRKGKYHISLISLQKIFQFIVYVIIKL